MPRYSVSCTVHEAVLPQQSGGNPVDPLVVMRCFGSERMTSVKNSKTTVACWDESFHWFNVELPESAWSVGVIEFELQSANAFWRNTTLGICALQLRLVCATSDGCYVGRLPLTSPNSVRVIGQLFVTVNVSDSLHFGGGSATSLASPTQQPDSATEERGSMQVPHLLSPLVYKSSLMDSTGEEYKYYHLYINVYTLEHVEVGLFGSTPSVTVEYGGCRLQSTKPVRLRCEGSRRPGSESAGGLSDLISGFFVGASSNDVAHRSNFEFNQCFLVPIRTTVGKPILEDNIVVRIWMGLELLASNPLSDRPAIAPKLLAEGVFSLAKLRARRQLPRWFNFYESTDRTACSTNQLKNDQGINAGNNKTGQVVRNGALNNATSKYGGPGGRGYGSRNKRMESSSIVDSRSDGEPADTGRSKATCYGHYIGRILMSASVKRLNKASDVLVAHVQSSHPLESAVSNPTRLFGDIYCIESRGSFGFEGEFEVMVEISCGPYETRSGWITAQRRVGTGDIFAEELGVWGTNASSSKSKDFVRSRRGWKVTLNTINGRLAPIELLASHSPEEQWLVFVRVHGRGTISGRHHSCVIASTSFPFDRIAEHSSKSQSTPFWVPLSCLGSTSTISYNDGESFMDPLALMDSVASMDPSAMLDHVVALDPTGWLGTAANEVLGRPVSADSKGKPVDPIDDYAKELAHWLPTGTKSQGNLAADQSIPKRPGKDKNGLISINKGKDINSREDMPKTYSSGTDKSGKRARSVRGSKSQTSDPEESDLITDIPTPGDMCDPGATVNILLTLHTHSFYSDLSRTNGLGNDIRATSRPQMASMLKQDYELRCYIYCARLGCAPHRNMSVLVSCDGAYGRTQMQPNFTRFPVFAECCTFRVTVPTLTSSRLAPPPPITVSLLFFDKKKRLLRMESAVTMYDRLVKSASGHNNSGTAPSPAWLKLSGGSSLLMFTELVVSSEASKVSRYQLSPLSTKCTMTLGLMGLRHLRVPAEYPLDGLLLKLSTQSYGPSVHFEQSLERYHPVGRSRWERGGRLNIDLFTVQEASFHIPVDPLFDPHIEFVCYAMSKGTIGPLLGYQSFRCYQDFELNSKDISSAIHLDLRHSVNPRRMVQLLSSLAIRSSHDVLSLQDNAENHAGSRLTDGVASVLTEFQSSCEYKRLLRSMDLEHVGMHVPPRFVIACDGRQAEDGPALGSVAVSADALDIVLRDIPFSTDNISPMAPVGTGAIPGSVDASDVVVLKYFLTIRHLKDGVVHRSYPDDMEPVATKASKMLRVLRGGLRNSLQKLRFCVISANNLAPNGDTLGSLFLSVEIGGSESREALICDRGSITKQVQRTWEQDLFLPEDSVIHLRVVNSFERIDGSLVDEVVASAQLDLENRWYSRSWQRMLRKDVIPVERVLLRDSNNNVHGSLDVIVQIGPVELFSTLRPFSFSKTMHSITEVRVVVWSTSGVHLPATPSDSRTKDQLDLYVVSTLDCQGYRGDLPLSQRTDTHYNCDSGSAQFNWRIVYPQIHAPVGACQLQLSVFDFWKVGPPTFVGEATLELRQYIAVVSTTATRIDLSGDLPLVNSSNPQPVGSLRVTVQVMTQSESTCSPAGTGRGHPNCKPFLPTPRVGRQWQDWFAHTSLGFDFGPLSVYVS
ncbi:uncharacterized protein BXIN_2338 [Babesia sp. Xinjiang]|uniref:uncharacterized protein n=1 Tax=Babesia sp. Xinjiang TaxID=462227 RepID=UPI000A239F40|nr:uncharacterized protein BXIN_2338 [Babesia sp. Xinjiang]ORM40784.1 hypothetical protein BXIN_2338 [Babesia sp. Xinjiang]